MDNITASIISGTVLVVITIVINFIYSKIIEKKKKPTWLKYFEDQQKHNLKTELTLFHADRKNEACMNSTEKKWVCESYEEYKKLGGNSYVDAIYEEIIKWEVID